jgi:N-acetylmuramoyl-L-alanine amidase
LKIRRALLLPLLAVAGFAQGQLLSPLAKEPDWKSLDASQHSITHDDFLRLLDTVYAPNGAWKPFIQVGSASASIRTRAGSPPYVLQFAASMDAAIPAPRHWRTRAQLPPRPAGKPLAGLHVALDPGHLGGKWAKMEERWFQIGTAKPVAEGDMTLLVAKLLATRLRDLGAEVSFTRSDDIPNTGLRPDGLHAAAHTSLTDQKQPQTPDAVQKESELLFYRVAEIRRRAKLINDEIRPDLVLCLHFNAEPWGDPAHPSLSDKNHLHLLVTGDFAQSELAYDDERFDMVRKLLSRAYDEELAGSDSVAASLAQATGLPPYVYTGPNAIRVGPSPYVWARNLLANRLYDCPVVYIEPYVMNSHAVFDRIQAGDYDGRRLVDGRLQPSIYREYADAVARGLADYYSTSR